MAWVHGRSFIIYTRKGSNCVDADNLTHRLGKKISAPVHISCVQAVQDFIYIHKDIDIILPKSTFNDTFLHVMLLLSVQHHTPAAHRHLLHSSVVHTQKHRHTSESWQWAKLGGFTITLLFLPASVIPPPNRLCPHALSLVSLLPSTLPPSTFICLLWVLCFFPCPLLGIGVNGPHLAGVAGINDECCFNTLSQMQATV